MRILAVIATLAAIPMHSIADDLTPEKIIESTVSFLKKNEPGKAFEAAFGSNPFSTENKVDTEQTKYQFVGFINQIGAPKACEPLVQRNLLNRYRIEQFLCLSPMQPFVIQFDFYRPEDKWRVQGFSFNTTVDDIMEESLKYEIGVISKLKANQEKP